jgi:Mn-dependent DtxR family transcriptional regulator
MPEAREIRTIADLANVFGESPGDEKAIFLRLVEDGILEIDDEGVIHATERGCELAARLLDSPSHRAEVEDLLKRLDATKPGVVFVW